MYYVAIQQEVKKKKKKKKNDETKEMHEIETEVDEEKKYVNVEVNAGKKSGKRDEL